MSIEPIYTGDWNRLLLSAGAFDDYGGWSLDTQFVTTMGSPYLLAHGLGSPVADAKTKVNFPAPGPYHVYVYTYNWVSPWKPEYAPGIFQIFVNGSPLPETFGAIGKNWGWQYGGAIKVTDLAADIALHDLTGFEGRCGMIYFSEEQTDELPSKPTEVTRFWRGLSGNGHNTDVPAYDVVVCGGGISGICAAISASRQGLKTALIQDRPVVGGNNSSEVRVWLGGHTNLEPYPGVGNIVNELEPDKAGHYGPENKREYYEDEKRLEKLGGEENLSLFVSHILIDADANAGAIRSIMLWDVKGNSVRRLSADYFVDATGDSVLGFLCGADFEMTVNGHMGMCNLWHAEETPVEQPFPACPWAIDLKGVDFPGRKKMNGPITDQNMLGCWIWESGFERDPIADAEYARDTNLRAMYGAWDCLKNTDGEFPNHRLGFCAYIAGKRESRRLLGDIILTAGDALRGRFYEDGCVPATWGIDLHLPDRNYYPAFHEGDSFICESYFEKLPAPYLIPYRCLYSRNIKNLFMAGRNISVTHDALGTSRIMRTCGMMGEVVGIAAGLCKKYGASPADIYRVHLEELKRMLKSIPKIASRKHASD